ncbi:hypothetical protein AB6A40_005681 [Gnathostoma spinigerum]|uniref:Uncharacterized protein n=1 Tax=Gnathostoma spinigerum TaxID=75299 RepID=A0ABD6EIC6_9BILA
MGKQYIRPSLKCPQRFDWNIPCAETSSKVLESVSNLIRDQGLCRQSRKSALHLENTPSVSQKVDKDNMIAHSAAEEEGDLCHQIEEDKCLNAKEQITEKIVSVGLRSVLRGVRRKKFSAVLLDANAIRPSAVSTALAVFALSNPGVSTYALTNMDENLSKIMNIKSVSAVGLTREGASAISEALSLIQPVTIMKKKKNTRSRLYVSADIAMPKGRNINPKKKKKKKKNNDGRRAGKNLRGRH